MYSPVYPPNRGTFNPANIIGSVDSGAFSDRVRLSNEEALQRQLAYERKASEKWKVKWQARSFVSYDRLIDEVWIGGQKHKRRWGIKEADLAVNQTVEAANYLSSQRSSLGSRKLILSCQGVDAIQYRDCAKGILAVAEPQDIIGLGGWCILGRMTSWLPEFWRTIYTVLPLIAASGNKEIHIFGVLYLPALGGLLWLADQYNLSISTDSSAPVRSGACLTERSRKKAGVRCKSGYWKDNVNWWQDTLKSLRFSQYYKQPPHLEIVRQLSLW